MIYYLEDSHSGVVLMLSNDRYLISNIADGLLDVHTRMFSKMDQTSNALTKHLSKLNLETGIKVEHNELPSLVQLDTLPTVVNKLQLIQLRKPAFEHLSTQYQYMTSINIIGLGPLDIVSIQYALSNPNVIHDYASILKLTEEFAIQELSMINNSVLSEQFRIFSVCNYWKEAINKATTKEEIDSIISRLAKSFVRQGGIDD
jgi:hypothetical protein